MPRDNSWTANTSTAASSPNSLHGVPHREHQSHSNFEIQVEALPASEFTELATQIDATLDHCVTGSRKFIDDHDSRPFLDMLRAACYAVNQFGIAPIALREKGFHYMNDHLSAVWRIVSRCCGNHGPIFIQSPIVNYVSDELPNGVGVLVAIEVVEPCQQLADKVTLMRSVTVFGQ